MINLFFLCQSEGCQISVPIRSLSNCPPFPSTCFPPPFLPGGGLSAPQEELDRLLQCRDQGVFLKSASTTPPLPGWVKGGGVGVQHNSELGPRMAAFFLLWTTPSPLPPPHPDHTGDLKRVRCGGRGCQPAAFPQCTALLATGGCAPPSFSTTPPTEREGGGGSRGTLAGRTSSTSRSSPRASPAAPGAPQFTAAAKDEGIAKQIE